MQSKNQQYAIWMWQSLPHALIWMAMLAQIALIGYPQPFAGFGLALPLTVALLWHWEWRSADIGFSLLLAGLCLDALSGMPLGWHGILWAGIYLLVPHLVYQFASDEPFITRWFICSGALAALIIGESLLAIVYGFAGQSLGGMLARALVMALMLPAVSWLIICCKKASYRKLWMLLPEEMHISFR